MKTKIIAVSFILLVATLFFVSRANAAVTTYPCSSGELCVYTDSHYGGSVEVFFAPTGCNALTGIFNDSVSSVHNYTSRRVVFYTNSTCSSFFSTGLDAGKSWSGLSGTGWNDVFSSFST